MDHNEFNVGAKALANDFARLDRVDAALVNYRNAMRVAPAWFEELTDAEGTDLSSVWPLFRASVLLPHVALGRHNADPKFLRTASYFTDLTSVDAAGMLASAARPLLTGASSRHFLDLEQSHSASGGAFAGVVFNEHAPRPEVLRLILESCRDDITRALEGQGQWFRSPLWRGADGHQFYRAVLDRLAQRGTFWPMLVEWYENTLDGSFAPLDWCRHLTEGPPRMGFGSDAAIAAAFHTIWTERERLDDAIAATENAERIEFNPATGKLRLVPQTELPPADGDYIRRKIVKAVEVFEGQDTQSYGALGPDWNMLRREVEDAGNLPAELYDACISANRRLMIRVGHGECPSPDQDPLIADYASRLLQTCADILGASPEVQDLVRRRAAIMGNDALIEAKEPILEIVAAAQEVSEGRLVNALAEDAQIATDSSLPADQRADASFRLSGRLLRIERAVRFGKEVWRGFTAFNRKVVASADYLQAMDFLANSPVVRAVLAVIWNYLTSS